VTTDAYILWSLTSAGVQTGLNEEISKLIKEANADSANDPYVIGLLSCILSNVGRKEEALSYAKRLVSFQKEDSYMIEGATSSITNSNGNYLNIETSSIAVLAWMPFQAEFSTELESTIKALVTSTKSGGRYGGTQSTVLAIKAITSYMKNYVGLNGSGKFVLYANDLALQTISFSKEEREAIKFTNVNKQLREAGFKAGETVVFKIALESFKASSSSEKDFKLQWALSATYNDLVPPSTSSYLNFSVDQTTSGTIGEEKAGKVFTYKTKMAYNNSKEGAGMAVAIIRVPSCLAMNFDLIEKMKDNGDFDMYEIKNGNSELVLYWRQMTPNFSKTLSFQMQQAYKGEKCQ
jgi:hypothetical protein